MKPPLLGNGVRRVQTHRFTVVGVVADGRYLSAADLDRMRARVGQYAAPH